MTNSILTRGGLPILRASGTVRAKKSATAPNDFDWKQSKVRIEAGPRLVVEIDPEVVLPLRVRLVLFDGTQHRNIPLPEAAPGDNIVLEDWSIAADPGVRAVLLAIDASGDVGRPLGTIPIETVDETPAAPGTILYSAATGAGSGEIAVTVLAPLPDDGDGNVVGDGLGGALTFSYRLNQGESVVAVGPLATATFTISGLTPSTAYEIELIAHSEYRDGPWGAVVQATSGGTVEPDPEPPVWLNPPARVLLSGGALSINWHDHWTGADSFDVLAGLTGGVESGTGNADYDVAALVEEEVLLHVTATNDEGTTTAFWSFTIEDPGVEPSLLSAIPDFIVPIRSTINYDVTEHFDGTDLVYSSPQSNATIAMGADGQFKTLQLLTVPIASSTWTIEADNEHGAPASDTITVEVTAEPSAALTAGELNIFEPVERFTNFRTPRFRFTGQPALLGANPFSFTSGQASVKVAMEGHNLVVGSPVAFYGASAAAGLTISGSYSVATVTNDDEFTITASGNANATTTGGGSLVVAYFPPTARALAANPFAFTSGSPIVTVTLSAHDLSAGRAVVFAGAVAAAGLTITGRHIVSEVLTANTFRIVAAANATSTVAAAGGAAVTMQKLPHNHPIALVPNPLSFVDTSATVTVAATRHGLQVGRPIDIRGAISAAGLLISGAYSVVTVPDADHFTITASGPANATTTGGGSNIFVRPQWHAIDWSTGTPDANGVILASQVEEGGVVLDAAGIYEIEMADPADNGDPSLQNPRTDYSVFSSTDTRADRLRFRYLEAPLSLRSIWSGMFQVPQIDPPIPVARIAQPAIMNTPGQYAAKKVGSPGMQFKPAIAWNEGVGDMSALLTAFAFQDEHSVDVTYDGGLTWAPARLWGMFAASGYAFYSNSDDDLIACWGGTAGEVGDISAGIYVGEFYKNAAGYRAMQHINVKDGTRQAFQSPGTSRVNVHLIHRRPNPNLNIAAADRPLFAVENIINGGAKLWRAVDPTSASSWEVVYSWTDAEVNYTGNVGAGHQRMFGIKIAPNGDLLVYGGLGFWVCSNPLAASPTFTKRFTGYVRGLAIHGGTASTVSGVYLALGTDSGYCRYASNARSGALADPGHSGLTTTGLGHLAIAHGKVWATTHEGGPASCKVSSIGAGGALAFSDVPSKGMVAPWAGFVYGWWCRHAGVYPCPHDVTLPDGRKTKNYAIAHVNQTLSVSIDGGLNFDGNNCEFYDHGHSRAFMHDRDDVDLMCMVQQDRSAQISDPDAGVLSWRPTGVTKGVTIGGSGGSKTLAQHFLDGDAGSGVTSGSVGVIGKIGTTGRKRIIAFLTGETGDQNRIPVIIEPNTAGAYTNSNGVFVGTAFAVTSFSKTRAKRGYYHPTIADRAVVGKFLIDNIDAAERAGVSFSIPSGATVNRECVGIQNDGGTVRSYWVPPGNTSTQVYLSEVPACTGQSLWKNTGSGNGFYERAICPDPFVAKRLIYCRAANMTIRELKEVAGTVQDNVICDLRPIFDASLSAKGVNTGAVGFRMRTPTIGYIACDPNKQDLIYALVKSSVGMPVLFRSIPGTSPLEFEDITYDLPLANFFLFLHPDTGDVFLTGSLGTWVLPPPTTNYPTLGGNKARHWNRLVAHYADAQVTNVADG